MKRIIPFVLNNLSRISIISVICVAVAGYWKFNKELHSFRRNAHKISMLAKNIKGSPTSSSKSSSGTFPSALQNIPLGEKTGLVLDVKKVSIRDVVAPYNASLIEHGDGYRLFFRYDVLVSTPNVPFHSYIGCADLDADLNQTEKDFVTIETGSKFSEDPRVIASNNQLYVSYNDVLSPQEGDRIIKMACLDPKSLQTKYVTDLDLQIQHIEKNWAPFNYQTPKGTEEIYVEYELNPRKLYKLPDPKINSLVRMIFAKGPRLQSFPWPKIWGYPSGGTPARLVDGQYLAFFHSRFKDSSDKPWYVMAAYTFEAHPPFKVTGVSHFPILFQGIYETPPQNSAPVNLNAVFPGGFVQGKKNGKDVLYVACGENDCAVKIITLDKEALLKSLKKIKS